MHFIEVFRQAAALLGDLEVFAEEVRAFVDRRLGGLPASLEAKLDALIEATNAMTAAIGAMAKVMAAPKMITTDDAGRPVGVKVDA